MDFLFSLANEQYDLVKQSRKVLLDYCETMSSEDFVNENNSFGRGGSARNLLVHIAHVYQYWVARHAMERKVEFDSYESRHNLTEVRLLFDEVDIFMNEFIQTMRGDQEDALVRYHLNGKEGFVNKLKLFTHVITHEFHHKGQILSLSRHLGYLPVDTDIIRG
ncbi:DinB family protein [Ferruginibacter sp. HRS2-29]|uniref:DinB family protein n=1 Tax=Ferruginibacter sp. HRS2-29 TaxID=2487334 RepID=UPI0020CF5AAD|nr:DinB family protein [Ferruginibacter sp. HRS2-29]MCP9752893.1 damage-inducible protein DinB [Ferruginibacter sp. HRS2-29]